MSRLLAVTVVWTAVVPVLAASPDPKDLAIPPGDLARAQDLIRRLGSEVYREREEAQTELAKMGRLARPALLTAAVSDPDPEVRFRCSRLLPRAGADDLKARLETYLADTEGKYEHNLPGLRQFRKMVGSDKLARDLFVEIFKSSHNVDLLEALDKSPTEAGRAISDRRMVLWNHVQQRNLNGRIQPGQPIPLQDVACLLFAETLVPSKEIPRNNIWNYITGVFFLQQPSSASAISTAGTAHGEAYKRIVTQWLVSREDPLDLNQLPYAAGYLLKGFKESQPMLRRIINTDGVAGYAKGQALMYLVQQRGKEEQGYLHTLLNNDILVTTVWFGNVPNQPPMQHQCLLKDVALAMLLVQSGQKMSDYGYIFPQGVVQNPNPQNIGYGNYAFPNEEARAAAFVKFGFWRMKQAGKPVPVEPTPKK